MDVKHESLKSTANHCEFEYEAEAGQEITQLMIVLGNLEGTDASNFLPKSDASPSESSKSSKSGSLKPVLMLNDCDIYCTLESSSCMVIVDKVEICEKPKEVK